MIQFVTKYCANFTKNRGFVIQQSIITCFLPFCYFFPLILGGMGWKEYVPDIHHLWYPVTPFGKELVMILWPNMCHISYQHLDFLPLVQTVQSLAQGSPRASFSFSFQWPRPNSCLFLKQKYFCSYGQGVHFDNSHPLHTYAVLPKLFALCVVECTTRLMTLRAQMEAAEFAVNTFSSVRKRERGLRGGSTGRFFRSSQKEILRRYNSSAIFPSRMPGVVSSSFSANRRHFFALAREKKPSLWWWKLR